MNEATDGTPTTPRNVTSWAEPVDKLTVGDVPAEAINLNVAGKRITGPLRGFGQMWQKTYTIRIDEKLGDAETVIKTWKEHFPEFWPEGNRFYGPIKGVEPGEVALLNLSMPGGMKVSTGIRVLYADEESFSFITPEGHMFCAMITFSAYDDDDTAETVIQIQALLRASDPVYEIGCRLGVGHKMEDEFWHGTLTNLGHYFGAATTSVSQQTVLVDKKVRWEEAKNIWHNAAIRTAVYMPIYMVKRVFGRSE